MGVPAHLTKHLSDIEAAFKKDGFIVQSSCSRNGRIGVSARFHCSGAGTVSKYKQAYYVEGDHGTMGWLLGFMAEPAIARMTTEYRVKAIAAFIDPEAQGSRLVQNIDKLLLALAAKWVEKMKPDIPPEFNEEIAGLYQGCLAANSDTQVTMKNLWELNAGTDAILARAYTGRLFIKAQVPIQCNSFAAPGDKGRRFFGRDFIFPTADVFQDVACLIIYRPDSARNDRRYGLVSQTAPGIIGSIAAVNSEGVAIGINMTASRLCNAHRPGFNGLLLNRYCMELADSAEAAKDQVLKARRGVAWVYPIADATGKAFVVEAGMRLRKLKDFPYLDYIPRYYRRRLPGLQYIEQMQKKYGNKPPDRGAVVRDANYRYPGEFITDWNKGLWDAFRRSFFEKLLDLFGDLWSIFVALITGKWESLFPLLRKLVKDVIDGRPYSPGYFGERGYIDKSWTQNHCPGPFYFAPQRESRPDVIIATNNFISPEMRLVGMNAWTALVARPRYDDFQWRYDELCKEVLEALDAHPAGLDDATAWRLINFLTPAGQFAGYYNPGGKKSWTKVQVHGSVNLCDLTARKMKSLFGYYGDDAITITLPRYLRERTHQRATRQFVFHPEDPRKLKKVGEWFKDAKGRYVLFRGVNFGSRSKIAPYLPVYPLKVTCLSKEVLQKELERVRGSLTQLKHLGFNVVRLVVQWRGLAPDSHTIVNDGYLDAVRAIVRELFKHGIYSLVDFHQDIAYEGYGGDGFPKWAIMNPPLPPARVRPKKGWSFGYEEVLPSWLNPFRRIRLKIRHTLKSFWKNETSNRGKQFATQSKLVDSIIATAKAFRDLPGVLGYEPFNEPHPVGFKKKVFEETFLAPFYEKVINGIGAVDQGAFVFIEPRVDWTVLNYRKGVRCPFPWNFIKDPSEIETFLPCRFSGKKTVLSFHYYDSKTAFRADVCGKSDDMSTKEKLWSGVYCKIVQAAKDRDLIPFLSEYGCDYFGEQAWQAPAKTNSRDYTTQSRAYMDLSLQQIEAKLLNSTLWVFDLYATHEHNDNWNDEDSSLLDRNRQIHDPDIVARPYPMRSSAKPTMLFFDSLTKYCVAMFEGTPVSDAPTVMYVPDEFQYPDGFEVRYTSGLVDWDSANHLLYWYPRAKQKEHQIVIFPKKGLDKSVLPQASQDLLPGTRMIFQSPRLSQHARGVP